MFKQAKRSSIESILVIFLFIIFSSAIAVIILQGARTFDRIITQKEKAENFRIASSYINMAIVKNDIAGNISVTDAFLGSQSALVVKHAADEAGLVTYIYYREGYLWELYLSEEDEPDHDLATKIVAVDDIHFSYSTAKQAIEIDYVYHNFAKTANVKQVVALETR